MIEDDIDQKEPFSGASWTQENNDSASAALWSQAQAQQADALANAARELGRLEATLAALPEAEAAGARLRLALIEVEAMLWAQGMVLRRDEIGRDLLDARASSDPEAMRLARWALRRLEGQADPSHLASFLGLHRRTMADSEALGVLAPRPQGAEFEAAATEFLGAVEGMNNLHPLARGPVVLMLWRMAGLSPPEQIIEPATWSARNMAIGAEGLPFVPLGRHGRRVWTGYGSPADRLAAHLAALHAAAREARSQIVQLSRWAANARAATAQIKGDSAARVIAVLAARPLASAMEVEASAGISRPTAERMLNRLTDMGLAREITGSRRFRLWATNMSS